MNARFPSTFLSTLRRFAVRPLLALTVLVGSYGLAGIPETAAATLREDRNAEIAATKKEIAVLKEQLRALQTNLRQLQAAMPQRPASPATDEQQMAYSTALGNWKKNVTDLNAEISATRQAIAAAEQRLRMLEGQTVKSTTDPAKGS